MDVLPDAVALLAPFKTREIYSELPYARKFAAVNHSWKLSLSGLRNWAANVSSESINTRLSAGPQLKRPAIAPSVVDTAGITVVRSISVTLTPGYTWKGIVYSPTL